MAKDSRPHAGDPPELTAPLEILQELLAIERERLRTAREIEKRREMVFPETTVIVRDIERLVTEVERREAQERAEREGSDGKSSDEDWSWADATAM